LKRLSVSFFIAKKTPKGIQLKERKEIIQMKLKEATFTTEKLHMKKIFLITLLVSATLGAFAQKWVDTTYTTQLTLNIPYGSSIDFSGTTRTHLLNICIPLNDTVPPCGRPLLLAIHGGAFLAGSKDQDQIPLWVKDFAKRGYVTASINYRLGMFQTNAFVNCNISLLGSPWNCLNMQDTTEWYRGAYRGMQDSKGALRYLINNAATYKIDPKNVFLVGESAGAIIALETAYLDMPSEKYGEAGALSNALPPNSLYENQCIQTPGFATSIASMQLARPDLGSIDGTMNPTSVPYTIKGVGSFYGALFQDLFSSYSYTKAPALYMFHQPNDLVVSYDYNRVEAGVAYCATQFPFNCQYLVNRPYIYGSKGIKNMIDNLSSSGIPLPVYQFDTTANVADCAAQIANPSLGGHQVDNPALRSNRLAQFFAPFVDTTASCLPTGLLTVSQPEKGIYPNPVSDRIYIKGIQEEIKDIGILNMNGTVVFQATHLSNDHSVLLPLLSKGVYMIVIRTEENVYRYKMVKN